VDFRDIFNALTIVSKASCLRIQDLSGLDFNLQRTPFDIDGFVDNFYGNSSSSTLSSLSLAFNLGADYFNGEHFGTRLAIGLNRLNSLKSLGLAIDAILTDGSRRNLVWQAFARSLNSQLRYLQLENVECLLCDVWIALEKHAQTLYSVEMEGVFIETELGEHDLRKFLLNVRDRLQLEAFEFSVCHHHGHHGIMCFPQMDQRFHCLHHRCGGIDIRSLSDVYDGLSEASDCIALGLQWWEHDEDDQDVDPEDNPENRGDMEDDEDTREEKAPDTEPDE
jgi:hypothetical protein